MQTEQHDAEVQQQFYKPHPAGEASRGRKEVQVSSFSEYPGMENPARPLRLQDIPSEMCRKINDARPESLPEYLAHYANQLNSALARETHEELVALVKEAEAVGHDREKLEGMKAKAADFFGRLELNFQGGK